MFSYTFLDLGVFCVFIEQLKKKFCFAEGLFSGPLGSLTTFQALSIVKTAYIFNRWMVALPLSVNSVM